MPVRWSSATACSRSPQPDLGLLAAWDASVALGGATLLHARMALFARLRDHLRGHICAGGRRREELDCAYVCSLGDDVEDLTRDELRDLFLDRLEASSRGGAAPRHHAWWDLSETTWSLAYRRSRRAERLAARASSARWFWRGRWPRSPSRARCWASSRCCFWTTS